MSQYGIRLMSRDFSDISWEEFKYLLSGLNENTPLGKLVAIRAEDNPDMLKNFTREQHNIRNKYRNKLAKNIDTDTYNTALNDIKRALINLAGE